jgi:hypothetical protein
MNRVELNILLSLIVGFCLSTGHQPLAAQSAAGNGVDRFVGSWKASISLHDRLNSESSDREVTIKPAANPQGWIGFAELLYGG